MSKIRSGDDVVVLVGKDRGKRGRVEQVLDSGKVVVAGVNLVKKHQKPNPMKGVVGGVIERSMPLDASNVAIFNAQSGKADRVGFKFLEDGSKIRVYKSTGDAVKAA